MSQTNVAIANLFLTMAELLQKEGANPYRVRAYRRAAATVNDCQEDIAVIAQRGDLDSLPGIGKDLGAKIREYLDTGTIQAYMDLHTPLPDFTKQWLHLPGFSEPIVNDLYFRLGIRSLDDLETLASSHLLRTRPGVTASTEELLSAIRALRKQSKTN
ncbi:histidinol-phosphatase [Candidatus Nitronereus thalassa]|uniref:Histidinol-phosphatase n=1 Tax=Candidatus Nitronereus thalassa TaxID=3020898 RepID=A0ABU3K3F4_9BACT|nr:histidinol-phosphatase [Candidatus Nitronereus thalassa]MDT7040910.1 histidinol-phosphatase [Candidatus Nitronereus thalassa]